MYVFICLSKNKLTNKQTKRIVILSVLKQNHHYFEKIVEISFLLESKYENVTGLAGLAFGRLARKDTNTPTDKVLPSPKRGRGSETQPARRQSLFY